MQVGDYVTPADVVLVVANTTDISLRQMWKIEYPQNPSGAERDRFTGRVWPGV